MIWRLLLLAAAAAAAVAWAVAADRDAGYVLIHYGPWSLETTLSLFTLGAALAFVAFYLALRFGGGLSRLPRRIGRWRRARRARLARRRLGEAVIAVTEGRWKSAERLAMEGLRDGERPELHLFTAAAAAHGLGDGELRDRHLYQAMDRLPEAEGAAGLLHAQWLMEEGKHEEALATLLRVEERRPRTPRLPLLVARCRYQLGDWDGLRPLLGELGEKPPAEWSRAAYLGLIERYAAGNEPEGLRGVWKELPEALRREEAVVAAYTRGLLACEAAMDVERFLRHRLEEQWSEELVLLYGELARDLETVPLLNQAEAWLASRERDGALLLTAGRLALDARLWGKARNYLEASVALRPRLEGYRLLARTLEQMGDDQALAACRRKALEKL